MKKIGIRNNIFETIIVYFMFVILALYAVSMLLPLLWMVWSSFKDPIDYVLNPFGFPEVWHPENYILMFQKFYVRVLTDKGYVYYQIPYMFFNSVLYSTLSSFVSVLWPALTAYIVSKYKFKGRNLIFNIGIITMIIPIIGTMPAMMRWMKTIGTYDNMIPQILLGGSPYGFYFILLYGAFKSLSWSYAEAAFVDGASHSTVMWRIMFPIMMPTFATIFLLCFISCWNNYQGLIIWMPSYPTLAVGVYTFKENAPQLDLAMPHVLCGYIAISIPTVIIWCSAHKLITSKLAVGGLKG